DSRHYHIELERFVELIINRGCAFDTRCWRRACSQRLPASNAAAFTILPAPEELCSRWGGAEQKTFRSRKRWGWLRKLFADVLKGMHACGKFVRTAKMFRRSARTFFGRRKCFAGLRGLFSDGAKGMHACGNIFRTETSRNTFAGAKDSVGSVRLMSSEGRTEAPKNTGPPDQRTITWPYSTKITGPNLLAP